MSRNTSVILGTHFDEFIKSEIDSGRYKSASEVIRNGLRVLEEDRHKILLTNEALIIGEQSGTPKKFDNDRFKQEMKKKLIKDA